MIGHTGVVNCLANAGCSKDEEYLVSSSDNGYVAMTPEDISAVRVPGVHSLFAFDLTEK